MCYDQDARTPAPPRVTGSATGTGLFLTASDGNRFAAYLATPEHPVTARAVLLPDVDGLRAFTREMALRFAETRHRYPGDRLPRPGRGKRRASHVTRP